MLSITTPLEQNAALPPCILDVRLPCLLTVRIMVSNWQLPSRRRQRLTTLMAGAGAHARDAAGATGTAEITYVKSSFPSTSQQVSPDESAVLV